MPARRIEFSTGYHRFGTVIRGTLAKTAGLALRMSVQNISHFL